ncbi:MAG: hypothetical protein LBC63_04755, partial [Holophagales bacterium]|nr:hypothetical protein [Holophagales bacterium]
MKKELFPIATASLALWLALALASCNGNNDSDGSAGQQAALPVPLQVSPLQINPEYEKWLAWVADGGRQEEIPGFPGRLSGYAPPKYLPLGDKYAPSAGRAPLPAKYDARELGHLAPVRDQGPHGTSWVFSGVACMEIGAKKSSGLDMDLSEWHAAWYTYNPINDFPGAVYRDGVSGAHEPYSGGGHPALLLGHMTRGGSVAEASAPYDSQTPPNPFAPKAAGVKYAYPAWLGGIADRDAIKALVQRHGAVSVAMHMSGSYFKGASYRCTGSAPNHFASIVGWDDNYPG